MDDDSNGGNSWEEEYHLVSWVVYVGAARDWIQACGDHTFHIHVDA